MTTPNDGNATADASKGNGADESQPSKAEVTELTAKLEASVALVAERDASLETANKSVTELQVANKKFADDAVGLANAGQQLKEAQSALEESRKTSTDLTVKLEEAATANTTLQTGVTTRRRQDLVKSGLPEDYVAGLDDAGLSTLESALPHMTLTKSDSKPNANAGTGYGLDNGAGSIDKSQRSDFENAQALIESMKTPK